MQTYTKQPLDQLDYDVNLTRWLPDGDTITDATASLDVDGELVVVSVQFVDGIVKVWLSGGVNGKTYIITVLVSTAGGRVKEVEFKLRVKEI